VIESRGGQARELLDTADLDAIQTAGIPRAPTPHPEGMPTPSMDAARAHAAGLVDPAIVRAEQALKFHFLPESGGHGMFNSLVDLTRSNITALQGAATPAARAIARSELSAPEAALLFRAIQNGSDNVMPPGFWQSIGGE
jgi:hypothetical protein